PYADTTRFFLVQTTNSGSTWVDVSVDSQYSVRNLQFTSATIGYAVSGSAPNFLDVIRKTTDSGKSWQHLIDGSNAPSYNYYINFRDDSNGFFFTTHEGSESTVYDLHNTSNGLISWRDCEDGDWKRVLTHMKDSAWIAGS